jgi:ABC-type phosphate transport system auxiliary subunit
MNPFEMVVMIVAITMGAWIFSAHLKAKRHTGEMSKDTTIADLSQKMLRLEQRVQTLEKLATDPAGRLSDEIERLRS